jgi:predicted nucleic acid-binding protein
MAYKLFIDTNVYLDYLMHRGLEWQDAENVLDLAEKNIIEVFTSASCLLNLMYIMRGNKIAEKEIIVHANNILSYSKLVNPDNTVFQTALSIGFPDSEDAVQYYTALHIKGIDYFITSNTRDYKKASSQLPVITPKQFMSMYNK